MKRSTLKVLAACALTVNLCAVVFFVKWLLALKLSSIAGHVGFQVTRSGPTAWLVAALALSILGVLSSITYLVLSGRSRNQSDRTWPRVLTSMAVIFLSLPALVIIPSSAWQLPAARERARVEAANQLREAAIHNQPAIDKLLTELKDNNYDVRRAAALKLANESWLPDSAIPTLLKAARREERETSYYAILALKHFPDRADEIVPGLTGLLEKPELGNGAAEVLAGNWKSGHRALMKASTSKNAQARQSAAAGLGKAGYFEADTVVRLTEMLGDEDNFVRLAAAMSLGILGAKSESALPALAALADDPDPAVRNQADIATGQIELAIKRAR